jgi:hypothetical protein
VDGGEARGAEEAGGATGGAVIGEAEVAEGEVFHLYPMAIRVSFPLLIHPRKVCAAAICPTRPPCLPCLLRSILCISLSLSLTLSLSLFFSSPHKPERKRYRACYRHSAEEFRMSSSCQLERGGPDAEAGQKGVFQTELKLNGIGSNPWEVLMRKAGCKGKGSVSSIHL